MQYPWSSALLDGRKTIETRRYELPQSLLGRKVYIIETPVGKDGESGILGDNFQNCARLNDHANDTCYDEWKSNKGPRIVGWSIFSGVKQYKSQQDFCRDEKYHLVPYNSTYGWQNDDTDVLYGWVISQHGRDCDLFFTSGVRRYRSLFQLAPLNENLNAEKEKCRPSSNNPNIIKEKTKAQQRHAHRTIVSESVSPRKKRRFSRERERGSSGSRQQASL
jgi:hypothetical protein